MWLSRVPGILPNNHGQITTFCDGKKRLFDGESYSILIHFCDFLHVHPLHRRLPVCYPTSSSCSASMAWGVDLQMPNWDAGDTSQSTEVFPFLLLVSGMLGIWQPEKYGTTGAKMAGVLVSFPFFWVMFMRNKCKETFSYLFHELFGSTPFLICLSFGQDTE